MFGPNWVLFTVLALALSITISVTTDIGLFGIFVISFVLGAGAGILGSHLDNS